MLVQLENIGKSYLLEDVETRALRDVTLEIAQGEYVAVEGPSGCGKSTLLSILGLLDSPTAGRYLLNGIATEGMSAGERTDIRNRQVGFIFQNFNLIGDLTIAENVELPLIYRGMTRNERRVRVHEVLERVNMTHRSRRYPMQLSGGEQQRAAVARALAGDPAILLADEPTGNLDTRNGESVMELLADLHAQGATIVMVTHDFRFAKHASRTIRMLDGQLVSEQVASAV